MLGMLMIFALMGWLVPAPMVAQQRIAATRVVDIGGNTDVGGIVLGVPNAVVVGERYVWIADEGRKQVVVFDVEARRSYSFGREGAGPGEFRTLPALALWNNGHVVALDRYNSRITELSLTGGAVRLVGTIPSPISTSESICSRAGRFIISGYRDGKLLHEVDANGSLLRSFGEPYRTEARFTALAAGNRGRLLCIEGESRSTPAVVATSGDFGIVRAYASDGSMLWATTAPGFRPMVVEPGIRGGLVYRYPPEGTYHHLVTVFTVDGGSTVHVQMGEIGGEIKGREQVTRVVTFVFSGSDGRLLNTTTELPRIDAVGGWVGAAIDNAMYPTVRVFRLGDR